MIGNIAEPPAASGHNREVITMGYTHYWNQERNIPKKDWAKIVEDVRAILKYGEHDCGIALANGMGEGGTSPLIDDERISFNGVGEGSHETFYITRKISTEPEYPGQRTDWGFCKTAQKPYDQVVVACLCYLSTVTRREHPTTHDPVIGSEAWSVSSDGKGHELLNGLDLARKALPRVANHLDLPMDVMKSDRWCAPWVRVNGGGGGCTANKTFDVNFCIDGKGYVQRLRTGESYCFETHHALARFLDKTKFASFATGGSTGFGRYGREEPNIWNASGSFDAARHNRIKRAQEKVLKTLFPVDPACAQQPPAYARPGDMPDNAGREFCYSLNDLLNLAGAK